MTIDDPRTKRPRPDSLGYFKRAAPNAPLSELLPKVIERRPPGMPERPLEPHRDADPKCKVCKGHGYKKSRQYETWFICSCANKSYRELLESMVPKVGTDLIGLTDNELQQLTWDKLIDDAKISNGGKALAPAKALFKQGYGLLFIHGNYGQGKTLLAKIIVAEAYRNGIKASYANVAAVLDHLRGSFDAQYQSTELLQRMDYWLGRKILCLDELGRANLTEWTSERLFILFDHRYTQAIREEHLTILISNKSDAALEGYMLSRLKDKRLWIDIDGKEVPPIIRLNGKDGRQTMPKNYEF